MNLTNKILTPNNIFQERTKIEEILRKKDDELRKLRHQLKKQQEDAMQRKHQEASKASQKAGYVAQRDDFLKTRDKDKTKKRGKTAGTKKTRKDGVAVTAKKKTKVAVAVTPSGRTKKNGDVAVAVASPATAIAGVTAKYTELKRISPTNATSLEVAMTNEIESICATQESSQSAAREAGIAAARAKARGAKELRELAAISEAKEESSEEEEFVCTLDHRDTTNFNKRIETKASAAPGFCCHLVPCRICKKRFFSKEKDATNEVFLVPTSSTPARMCANEGKGCREAMCSECFDCAIGSTKRARRSKYTRSTHILSSTKYIHSSSISL